MLHHPHLPDNTMNKLALSELDDLLKSAAEVPDNGRGQLENPHQTGENSSKPPALRAPIDKAMGLAGAAAGGAVGLAAGLSRIKTKAPMQEVP